MELIRDAVTAARASWGVASSGEMPRWRDWMASCTHASTTAVRHNPGVDELERAVATVAADAGERCDGLPWNGMRSPLSRRLYAGLVSFVDDYPGRYPEELFPRAEVHALRRTLRETARASPLTIDEQLRVAASVTGGRLFAAAVLLHAVTRLVARNRDRRALGDLAWEERLRDLRWIAPFAPEVAAGGDPPGDTYHYWANFVVGMHAAMRGRVVPRALGATFYVGPIAMTWIRGGLFGRELFAGAHAACDRAGLRHGITATRAMGGLGP